MLKNNLNLIILDDDKVQRYAVKRQLINSKYKFNVFEADCGENAMKILKQTPIDCIIVDYILPQYDGLEFVEHVKEKFGNCPPFLFITSFGSGDVVRKAFKKGCFDYIPKEKINSPELLTMLVALAEHSRTKTEMSEKLENLELLAAEVTHDLNSPLRSISYSIDQMIENDATTNSDHFKNHMTNIKSNVHNIGSILSDIANGLACKDHDFNCCAIDLNDLISELIESIVRAFSTKTVKFSLNPLPILRGDRAGLFRVLYNIVSNGIKYNDQDVIEISISHEETVLYNEIVIQDNGIGISSENLHDIFQPFYRINVHEQTTGTGLGLAICQKIIDQHNGKIFVESTKGLGSKFKIALPRTH